MSDGAMDGPIDQLVKARWLAIGLSQTDIAEVLGAALSQTPKDGNGANGVDGDRLMQVAEALNIPFDFFPSQPVTTEPDESVLSSALNFSPMQSFLELRLLRAFHELRDHRTRRMLIHLAEQIVKRQNNCLGDAG
jgi:transcriptional regulator with XRE-family HTH domain